MLLDNMTLRKRRHLPNRYENLFEKADEFHVSTASISIAPQVTTHLTVPIIFSTLICLFIIQLLWRCDLY